MGKKFNKKKAKGAKYLQDVLRLGNFIIKKKGDGEFSYIKVGTIDGAWGMEFREDTFKYAWILMLSTEERYREILRAWLTVSYHTVMCNPDPEFLNNAIKELQALGERAVEREKERPASLDEEP